MPEVLSFEGWEVDLSSWTQNDKVEMLKAQNAAAQDGDESRIYPFLARAVKKWPFQSDPAIPENYGLLLLSDYKGVILRVRERLKSYLA